MGCDIHAVFQKKTPEGWVDVPCSWEQDRHYALFGWLADVRRPPGITPIAERRGLPEDLRLPEGAYPDDYFGEHSYSWVTAEEVIKAPNQLFVGPGCLVNSFDEFSYFIDIMRDLQALHGEVRMVFGFDS